MTCGHPLWGFGHCVVATCDNYVGKCSYHSIRRDQPWDPGALCNRGSNRDKMPLADQTVEALRDLVRLLGENIHGRVLIVHDDLPDAITYGRRVLAQYKAL